LNILDELKAVLAAKNIPPPYLGYLPAEPTDCVALFEYSPAPPEHHFGGVDFIYGVQTRCRALRSADAYASAKSILGALNRYCDKKISVLAKTPILDIGRDNMNPQNQEYTVNFEIRRLS